MDASFLREGGSEGKERGSEWLVVTHLHVRDGLNPLSKRIELPLFDAESLSRCILEIGVVLGGGHVGIIRMHDVVMSTQQRRSDGVE